MTVSQAETLEITDSSQVNLYPTTCLIEIFISQLLSLKLEIGGLLWGAHWFCCTWYSLA